MDEVLADEVMSEMKKLGAILGTCEKKDEAINTLEKIISLYILAGDQHGRTASRNTDAATHQKKSAGETTKEKVRINAAAFRHQSKETASIEIARRINVSRSTVAKYLTELFPGKAWHT